MSVCCFGFLVFSWVGYIGNVFFKGVGRGLFFWNGLFWLFCNFHFLVVFSSSLVVFLHTGFLLLLFYVCVFL
ncbi:hypothetical protein QBC41DRAFT_318148 [Cercophora samala]|uniref:Uncharacterized protein n=1 Tax=Cercophora samala TaxID=330535 RepID=A0AA40DDT1_9PEZI|nr:hypothetical protein QBC41DRAFT_318148 [Cercophora samala]